MLVSRIESEAECEGTEESNEDDAIFCCEEEKTKATQQKELRKWFDFVVFVCNKDLDEITKCE